jgi:HlyD family secretion protein
MKRLRLPVLTLALLSLATAACARVPEPDAYGNVEATPVVIAAETSGRLLSFTPTEGTALARGAAVALVDTIPLALQRDQVVAQRTEGTSRIGEVTRQIGVLDAQREIAQRAYQRIQRLFAQQAATAEQLDQAERDYRTLEKQTEVAGIQRQTAERDTAATAVHVAQIGDQIRRSRVLNPLAGTVLTTYVEPGEFVQPGQALYRIASLDTVDLRAYVSEPQLTQIRLGQAVQISVDAGAGHRTAMTGIVSWIASEAEFTPTPIQTRDERTNLVYAIKIRVPNRGGLLKIGMPADVRFGAAPAT